MATLPTCVEGHAFDMAPSETCPICGSTVWKNEPVKEPVYENKPPLDRTKIIELAVVTVSFTFSLAVIFAIAFGIGQLMPEGGIKSVVHDVWARVEASWEHAQERTHPLPGGPSAASRFKKACEEIKLHDPNVVCPVPHLFPPPKPQNPFVPKPEDTVDRKPENPFVPKPGNPFEQHSGEAR
jgi:hypothetical protein